MMVYTPPDSSPSGTFTDTRWDTYIRDNENHLHDLLTLYATNKSVGPLGAGAVVAVRTGADAEVEETTVVGDPRRIGVAFANQLADALGYIGITGHIATVRVTGAVKRLDPLQTSATAQRAQAGRAGAFATAITPNASGTGTVAALLGVVPPGDTLTPTTKTTASNVTYTAAEVLSRYLLRDPNGAPRTDTLPTAALLVAAIQNPQVGDWLELWVRNEAGAANAITMAVGAGGTSRTGNTLVIAQGFTGRFAIRLTNVGSGTETYDLFTLSVAAH